MSGPRSLNQLCCSCLSNYLHTSHHEGLRPGNPSALLPPPFCRSSCRSWRRRKERRRRSGWRSRRSGGRGTRSGSARGSGATARRRRRGSERGTRSASGTGTGTGTASASERGPRSARGSARGPRVGTSARPAASPGRVGATLDAPPPFHREGNKDESWSGLSLTERGPETTRSEIATRTRRTCTSAAAWRGGSETRRLPTRKYELHVLLLL